MSAEQFSLLPPSSPAGPGRVSGSERAPVGVGALAGGPGPVGLLGLPARLPGETWRGKSWHMFRAPNGRAASVLVESVELGRHVGRLWRMDCPAIGFSLCGGGEVNHHLVLGRRLRAWAAERLGCRVEDLDPRTRPGSGATTTAWRGETRAVIDGWANEPGVLQRDSHL